jgi:hypothetical protein
MSISLISWIYKEEPELMDKLLFLLILFSFQAKAMMPLGKLIYGNVEKDKLYDPLENIFEKKHLSVNQNNVNYSQLKLYDYLGMFMEGEALKNTCEKQIDNIRYISPWQKDQAVRSSVATFQYITLDVLTRAIAKYAQKLKWRGRDYEALVNNLVNNYCSKNITVYSVKRIRENLIDKFENKNFYKLPQWRKNDYFNYSLARRVRSDSARKKEMAVAVKLFRNICSWNGSVDDFRLMNNYLQNPYLMSYIFRNIQHKEIFYDFDENKIKKKDSVDTVQVLCENFICRKTSNEQFIKRFPRMVGSSSLGSDLERLYCYDFLKREDELKDQNPQIKQWLQQRTPKDAHFEESLLISLITGAPDLSFSVDSYKDFQATLRSSIKERWDRWAKTNLEYFDNELLYEESLLVEVIKQDRIIQYNKGNFSINLQATLGEVDRGLDFFDKLKMTYFIKLPRDYVQWAWKQQRLSSNVEKMYERDQLRHHVEEYIKWQLANKDKRYVLTPWDNTKSLSGGIERLLAPEFLRQLDYMSVKKLRNLPENIYIPVHVHYGLFALKYMRYKFRNTYRSSGTTLTFNK